MKILESYKKIAKSMLTEHAWDRKFGAPLPTLEDVMKEASQDDEDYVGNNHGNFVTSIAAGYLDTSYSGAVASHGVAYDADII